jgi:hypothetical protein
MQCGKGFTWYAAPKHVCANRLPDAHYIMDSITTHSVEDLSPSKKKGEELTTSQCFDE